MMTSATSEPGNGYSTGDALGVLDGVHAGARGDHCTALRSSRDTGPTGSAPSRRRDVVADGPGDLPLEVLEATLGLAGLEVRVGVAVAVGVKAGQLHRARHAQQPELVQHTRGSPNWSCGTPSAVLPNHAELTFTGAAAG